MPVGWYIVPYKRRDITSRRPTRYPAIDDYTPQIYAAGGQWAETEVLGNRAIVKVQARQAVLDALDGVFKRLPKDLLNSPLSDLTNTQKKALRDELLDMGYTAAEIRDRLGNDLGAHTLRDVLRFIATRRLKPRYDVETDTIVLDGPVQICRSIDGVDVEVS